MDNISNEFLNEDNNIEDTEETKAAKVKYKDLFAQMDNPKSMIDACSKRLKELGVPHFFVINHGQKAQPFYYNEVTPLEIGITDKLTNAFFFEYMQHKLLSTAQYKQAQKLIADNKIEIPYANSYILGTTDDERKKHVIFDIEHMLAGMKEENMYSVMIAIIMSALERAKEENNNQA